jgi:CheY-like chemotaxis protein
MMKQVLIVDDATFFRSILENFLKPRYEVIVKGDGLEALMWLQDGNMPNLIVADLKMPNVDGYELVKQLRDSILYKDIPVIVLSSSEDKNEYTKFYDLGIHEFIIKPFNPEDLESKIAKIIS